MYICNPNAEIAQLVERNLAKVEVAGPNPVFRSKPLARVALYLKDIRFDECGEKIGEVGEWLKPQVC